MADAITHRFILYVAITLDGYLAGVNDDLSFLDRFRETNEDYGFDALMGQVDSLVMGARTYRWEYDHTDRWPHGNKRTWIVSHDEGLPLRPDARTEFFGGSITGLGEQIRESGVSATWIVGGGDVVRQFLDAGLVDEFDLFVVPTLLGRGLPLFPPPFAATELKLVESHGYPSGMVRLRYQLAAT